MDYESCLTYLGMLFSATKRSDKYLDEQKKVKKTHKKSKKNKKSKHKDTSSESEEGLLNYFLIYFKGQWLIHVIY